MTHRLILASSSVARAQMLHDCGVPFDIAKPQVDEMSVKQAMLAEGLPPRDIADALADLKARKIALKAPQNLILGSDQVLTCAGKLFDKPTTLADARDQLTALRGASHELLSAAVIYEDGRPVWRHIGRAQLIMRDFSDAFLDDYISRHGDDLLTTVGCYKLEADGPTLFSRIQGDYFSVLGMPLLDVLAFLRTRRIVLE